MPHLQVEETPHKQDEFSKPGRTDPAYFRGK
jgi:hypothetical protein